MERDKNTRKHLTQESKDVNPFPADDHKDAINRQDSIKIKIKDPQKKYRLGTVSIITGGLKHA